MLEEAVHEGVIRRDAYKEIILFFINQQDIVHGL